MEPYLWWAIAGLTLIIVELMSGTFYLLVIGIAALTGALASYLNYSFGVQAVVAAVVATIGVVVINRYRTQRTASTTDSLDVGQSVVFELWISERDRLGRVRYRNAEWDAHVDEAGPVAAGDVLCIHAVSGNTLHVSRNRK